MTLTVIARFTTWGRQFWHISGAYFTGRQSIPVWAWLGVLLMSVMVGVRINVLFSYQGNDQYSALQTAFGGAVAGNTLGLAFAGLASTLPGRPAVSQ